MAGTYPWYPDILACPCLSVQSGDELCRRTLSPTLSHEIHILARHWASLSPFIIHCPHLIIGSTRWVWRKAGREFPIYDTRSLGALRTSSLRPFGPAWLRPSCPSGAQAVWPTQCCIRWWKTHSTQKSEVFGHFYIFWIFFLIFGFFKFFLIFWIELR